MSWFEHGGSRIYYEEFGAGEPVLLLPGFSQGADELSALRDALATSFQVIAADLPGSGRSEPQPRVYTANYYADDAQSLTALVRSLAIEPAHLVGFSDGGEVALLMAAQTPSIARSVATWGAAGVVSDPSGQLREMMDNLIDNPIPPMRDFRDHLVATYGEANARAMTKSVVGAFTAIIANGGDISRSQASAITCPVLLIAGEHDFFATPDLLAQLAANIRDVKTVTVEGAGHDVQNSHPDWLAQTLLDWLQGAQSRERVQSQVSQPGIPSV